MRETVCVLLQAGDQNCIANSLRFLDMCTDAFKPKRRTQTGSFKIRVTNCFSVMLIVGLLLHDAS